MKARNFFCFFSVFFLTVAAHAAQYSHLEEIVALSGDYLKKEVMKQQPLIAEKTIQIVSNKLSTRLKLQQCDKPLTFSHRRNTKLKGTASIKVSCHSPVSWSIYTKHRIQVKKNMLVAKHSLPKGHIISDDDLNYIYRDINHQRSGFIDNKQLIVGRQLSRPINTGEVIYHHQLTSPQLIKKGDKLSIVAKIGGLSVITPGIALSDGRLGEQIDIKNQRSSRIIRAEITGQRSAEVIL